jgi:hypothetical protein
MKKIIIITLLILTSIASVEARDVNVRGYSRSDGTYVEPHHRSSPNNTQSDNYGTRGNTNPYTGQEGTRPDSGYNSIYR